MELVAAALLFSAMGAGAGPAHSATQEIAADVGHVEDVSGRVVAFSQGKPTLLDALDVISDRTRLDLQANSELRLCHYPTSKLLTLKGPLRASISRDGVTVENSKAVVAATGSCVAPVVSTFQGGIVSRGTGVKTTNVPLQPNIKVVNRGDATDPQDRALGRRRAKTPAHFRARCGAAQCSMKASPIFWSSNATTAANSR